MSFTSTEDADTPEQNLRSIRSHLYQLRMNTSFARGMLTVIAAVAGLTLGSVVGVAINDSYTFEAIQTQLDHIESSCNGEDHR